ncbi:hypothetical protein [Aquimarina aquimarini]|uniref:hypothetical protein n=1 Tax=Aquimarina aquimarini TaxID=1191734 RepID=UPI001F28D0BE|nr:hypothetical protein [Aquimarina aquimarini]
MRKLASLSLLITFIIFNVSSCKSIQDKNKNFIPYLLPLKIERAVFNGISYIPSKKKIAFYFDFKDNGTIDIWADTFSQGYDQITKLSNRKLFINDKFYPLTFSSDETFQAILEDGHIVVKKNCYYHKPNRKEVITKINLPILSEREKLFPYIDDEPCQISQKRAISMRHQGYLLTIDTKGNLIEIDKRPDGLRKIEEQE